MIRTSALMRVRGRVSQVLVMCLAGMLAVVGAGLMLAGVTPSFAATDSSATVSADALPTVQVDGVVFEQAIIGDIVYAVGSFSTARPAGAPPGEQTVPRSNVLAYNLTTGALVESFAPSTNGRVLTVATSPDGSKLYIGGEFTSVNGVSRARIAAIDPMTGATDGNFRPNVNWRVSTIATHGSTVYFGGWFSAVGNQSRTRLAAVDGATGALRGWAPVADDAVEAMVISPDGSHIAVGGRFSTLNGSSDPGTGMGLLRASDGASLPWAVNSVVRNRTDGGISTLTTDGEAVYGTGWDYGGYSNFEGTFSASWNGGAINWIEDCHGDTHSVVPHQGVVYIAGHPHSCSGVGGFPETSPRSHYRSLAFSTEATGVLRPEPSGSTYFNFGGQPAPSLLNWFPDLNIGSYTGQNQGPWTVSASGEYVAFGGEFTQVNGGAQQGLVRFTMRDTAPNKRGPRLSGTQFPVTATSSEPGNVSLSWQANHDQDDEILQYKIIRDGNTVAPVGTVEGKSRFYDRPDMSYQDTSVAAGSHTYRIVATDPAGNTAASAPVTVTVAGDTNPEEPTEPTDGTVLLEDLFDRTGTGWGSPTEGVTWTTSGMAFSTGEGRGTASWTKPGTTGTASLTGMEALLDTDVTTNATLVPVPNGGGGYLVLRSRAGDGDEYRATTKVTSSGGVTISLGASVDGSEQKLASQTVAGLTYAAGDRLSIRVSTTGANPTTVRMKVWKSGTTEPTAWNLEPTSSTAELQDGGGLGMRYYVSSSATNGPGELLVEDFVVRDP